MQWTNIPLLLNIISFSVYIINITTSWRKPQGPCCLQQWFCRGFFILQTIKRKQWGLAEQCKEGLNHHRGASLSRGCVLPTPALRSSAGSRVTAWKTMLSKNLCRRESKQTYPGKNIRANKSKSSLIPSREQGSWFFWVHTVWGQKPVFCPCSRSQHSTRGCLRRNGTGKIQCPRQEIHSSSSHMPFLKSGKA